MMGCVCFCNKTENYKEVWNEGARENAVGGTFWKGLGRTVVDSGAPAASPWATNTDRFAAEGVTCLPQTPNN